MNFPVYRARRLRASEGLRRMVRQTRLSVDNLVMPCFVVHGKGIRKEIRSMPGRFHLSIDELVKEVEEAKALGIPAILLFGIPKIKDELGSESYAKDGIIQMAVAEIKARVPDIVVITDLCLCEYVASGHCGIVRNGRVVNDETLELLARIALSQAEAGADVVAPSDMMDGRVGAIRRVLDEAGFSDTAIMSYSAKYASSFYSPFREAADCAPRFSDRASYQLDIANSDEALREIQLDIAEGADIVMVKPALAYLDLIFRVKEETGYPVAAYSVSGEYSMIKAASSLGFLDEKRAVLETLTCIKRAGADIIITYFARDVAKWLG
ncbi:MAG: porphobilinogen synthase [bacterium]|nr:porphobilinogen synthase [bacterium]